jgi:hypothetical protein
MDGAAGVGGTIYLHFRQGGAVSGVGDDLLKIRSSPISKRRRRPIRLVLEVGRPVRAQIYGTSARSSVSS